MRRAIMTTMERIQLIERCTRLATALRPAAVDSVNTYFVRAPLAARGVVVDPGEDDVVHLGHVESRGEIELILLTHAHQAHAGAAYELSRRTGAVVRGKDPSVCMGAQPLANGETLLVGGTRIVVHSTPGHSDDSVCLELPDDASLDGEPRGSVMTGDTVSGTADAHVAYPGGDVRAHLESLASLVACGSLTVLPGHGASHPDLVVVASECAARAARRLEHVQQIASGLLGPSGLGHLTVEQVAAGLRRLPASPSTEVDDDSIAAQLAYLQRIRS